MSQETVESIFFFYEDIDFTLPSPHSFQSWLLKVSQAHHYNISELNYIFCSDTYLHKINVEYLNHDTYTDIITFDNSDEEGSIESDIFVSIDRVKENATDFNTSFEHELKRVMVHGLLHLVGFGDKTDKEKAIMRSREEKWVDQWG